MKITVVGAGIIGCAVAHELASRGASVHIIDMRGTGAGATQASAGILAPYVEGHSEALLRIGVMSLSLYDAFIAQVMSDAGRAVEYERLGTLQIALNSAEATELEAAATRYRDGGIQHTLMTGDEARRCEPLLSRNVVAGLLMTQHSYVRAGELTAALSQAATRRGVTTTVAPVERLEERPNGVAAVTATGSIEGDAVVVAAGSWTSTLAEPSIVPPPVRPVRGQLLQLHFDRRPLSHIVWGSCYLVPWRDGSLLVGATVEDAGFEEHATAAGVTQLLEGAAALMPGSLNARFEAVRVGLRPGTPDELPLIGPSSTMRGVYYAAGHYRNGVLLSPLTAKLVADLVIDGRRTPELELMRPDRFGL